MLLRKSDIGRVSRSLCALLDREDITCVDELSQRVGDSFQIIGSQERVEIALRPSNYGTQAYVIDYIIEGTGVPLSIRVNPSLRKGYVILKFDNLIEGYTSFAQDPFGNIPQAKELDSGNLSELRNQLDQLSSL